MDFAQRVAKLSHARRLQVGAVIVKDDTVISYGYNGMPAGWDNNCEDKIYNTGTDICMSPEEFEAMYPYTEWNDDADEEYRYGLKTKSEVLHAERNALDKLAKRGGVGGNDAFMFITHAPCIECAKSIHCAGIKEIYYREQYRSTDGIEFLKKCNVKIKQIDSK